MILPTRSGAVAKEAPAPGKAVPGLLPEVAAPEHRAAEERAAELAKVNDTLRRGLDRVADPGRFEDYVTALLLESARVFQADAAAVFLRRGDGLAMHPVAVVDDGRLFSAQEIAGDFFLGTFAEVTARDPDGITTGIATRGHHQVDIDARLGEVWPQAYAWHHARGHRTSWQFPLRLRGETRGFFAFALRRTDPLSDTQVESVVALAQQFTLALELIRLGEEARRAAVVREQEKAARDQVAALTRVNEALRGGVARLVDAPDIEGILDVCLLEAIRLTDAAGGAVLRRAGAADTEFVFATLAHDNVATRRPQAAEFMDTLSEVSRRDPAGFFARVVRGEFVAVTTDELAGWYPSGAAYHRRLGNRIIWNMPFRVNGQVAGYLGLAFQDPREPDATTLRTLEALALQTGMTMELRQKSEEARQAAVARERARAAQERAAALADTNQLLQRSIGRLSLQASPEEFARPFLEEMCALLDADSAAQFRVDEAAGTLTEWAYYDQGQWGTSDAKRQARIAEIPAWAEIITHPGQPAVFDLLEAADRARVYPDSVRFLDGRGCTWLVNLPLVVGGRAAWVLAVDGRQRGRLTAGNLEVFTTLARQLTLALELHRLGEEARCVAVAHEREHTAREQVTALIRTNQAVGDSLNELVELTDLRAFLRRVFGQCARIADALGGSLFFHDERSATLRKELGWIKGRVIDFAEQPDSPAWHEPVPVATIPDWAEFVQIDPQDERVWTNARPWHRACGYGWMCRVPIKAGAHAFGFMGMAFTRREDLTGEKVELICAMSHQIALAVQLDRLAGEARDVALLAERNRIARDLHDALAQGFVGVLTQLGVLEGALEAADGQEVARAAQRARAIARDGLEEARRSVHALRPPEQSDRLFERLRALVAGLTAGTGLHAETTQTGTPAALPDQADWAAVKFAQQALTNTLRYAAAATFRLTFTWRDAGLTLTARDDGQGFNVDAPRAGIGLRAMAERAAECGGSLRVESAVGQGTALRLFLPVPRAP